MVSERDRDGVLHEFWEPKHEKVFYRPGFKFPPKHWLLICLDGVPLEVMQRFWDRGHFRKFYRPTAVLSVFPSENETAPTDALPAPPVPGDEQLCFDSS